MPPIHTKCKTATEYNHLLTFLTKMSWNTVQEQDTQCSVWLLFIDIHPFWKCCLWYSSAQEHVYRCVPSLFLSITLSKHWEETTLKILKGWGLHCLTLCFVMRHTFSVEGRHGCKLLPDGFTSNHKTAILVDNMVNSPASWRMQLSFPMLIWTC